MNATRRVVIFGVVVMLVGVFTTAMATAGVERYQIQTETYELSVNGGLNPRTVIVTTNPCDGTSAFSYGGEFYREPWYEYIMDAGFVNGSIFVDFRQATGYFWGGVFPVGGGGFTSWSGGGVVSGYAELLLTSTTDYKNHGQYVSEMGPDAAHSCIGMPVVSQGKTG